MKKTPIMFMLVGIEPKFFTKVAQEWCNPDCTQLIPRFADQQDPLLLQLGLTLKAELEQGCPGGKLYIDSITQLISVHLLKTYSNNRPLIKSYSNPLPNKILQSVIEYIHANLDREISLTELAQIARVNHYYFCTLFKKSTGVSPHRYILQQRIEHAKKLLKNSQNTIVDIALQCGFVNQSHFTRRFHEITGLTPKVYRNQV